MGVIRESPKSLRLACGGHNLTLVMEGDAQRDATIPRLQLSTTGRSGRCSERGAERSRHGTERLGVQHCLPRRQVQAAPLCGHSRAENC
jgi:hypothetical protein